MAIALLPLLLSGCGGGGSASAAAAPASTWVMGVFKASSGFAAQCAVPRAGVDPITHQTFPDMQGSVLTENNWLRSWTNELYLWYSEVPDLDPGQYTTAAYFNVLKTSATSASGSVKDKFHFTYPTTTWEQLSLTGVQAGYGLQWALISATPPRSVVIAYTEPNSPATAASLARGAEVSRLMASMWSARTIRQASIR